MDSALIVSFLTYLTCTLVVMSYQKPVQTKKELHKQILFSFCWPIMFVILILSIPVEAIKSYMNLPYE
jgi:hypothetical protein